MKLRLTAFSISSIDMNTVMMLRRNRKPATPSANSTALSVRYQEIGTRRESSIRSPFAPAQSRPGSRSESAPK